MDISNLRYVSGVQSDEWSMHSRVDQAESVKGTADASQNEAASGSAVTQSNSTESVFASALRDEIAQLREKSSEEDASAASLLSDSAGMLFGTTESLSNTSGMNLGELSQMLASTSGRQAIAAMAEASLNSIVFSSSEDNQQTSMLDSLLQDGSSVQEELADTLEQILNRLEEGNAVSE